MLHQIPLGGEDLARYASSPRLIRAAGTEPFDTAAGGETVIEHPEPGEVVWCDSDGVTCRRWNWRQGRRTQLREDTTTALFIFDALDPMTDEALHAAAGDLVAHLTPFGPERRDHPSPDRGRCAEPAQHPCPALAAGRRGDVDGPAWLRALCGADQRPTARPEPPG